jgi:hypothetical protein
MFGLGLPEYIIVVILALSLVAVVWPAVPHGPQLTAERDDP